MSFSSRCLPRCSGTSAGLFAEPSRWIRALARRRVAAARDPRPHDRDRRRALQYRRRCRRVVAGRSATRVSGAPRAPRRGARDRCRRSTNRRTRAADPYPGARGSITPRSYRCLAAASVSPSCRHDTSGAWPASVVTSWPFSSSSLRQRSASSRARSNRPVGSVDSAASRPASEFGGVNAGVEATGAGLRHPRRLGYVVRLGARVRDEPRGQQLGIGDEERTGQVGAAEPLLAAHGVEVRTRDIDRDRADALRAVDEHRHLRRVAERVPREHLAVDPRYGRRRDQPRARGDLALDQVVDIRRRRVAHPRDPEGRAACDERPGESEVLCVGGDDLVARADAEADHGDMHALRRRLE